MGLANVQQLVDDKLRSAALGGDLAGPEVRDRAIAQAVLRYGTDAPQVLWADEPSASGAVLDLPAAWVAGRSLLLHVEHPVGFAPMRTLEAAVLRDIAGDWKVVLADGLTAEGLVRVHFTAPHVLTGEASTVPAEHEDALACLAVAELCRQLATQKGHERDVSISAAAVNGATQSGDLARRARDWERQYRTVLGLPDPEQMTGPRGAGANVSWRGDDRPRPRFYSYQSLTGSGAEG